MAVATPRPVLAEVAVEPSGEDGEHRRLLKMALDALSGPELERRVGPTSTVLSGELHDVIHAIERAHTIIAEETDRVITTVRLESRTPALSLEEREQEVAELRGGEPALDEEGTGPPPPSA